MGLFSSTEIVVASSSLLLVDETPDLVKQSVSTSILKSRDIAPDLVSNYLNGIYVQSRNYYNYGKSTYVWGLPDGSRQALQTQDYKVAKVIEEEVGNPVTLVTNVIDVADGNYFAYPYMTDNWGWDYSTDIIANPPIEVTGTARFIVGTVTGDNELTIQIQDDIEFHNIVVNVPIHQHEYYYHVIYYNRSETIPRYWNYWINSNVYPELDSSSVTDLDSPYFPVVPIRQNNVDMTADKDTDLYRTSKRLLQFIDLDIDDLAEGVNSNPDVGDIDHAYVILAADLKDDTPEVIEYLHEFFTYLGELNPAAKNIFESYEAQQALYGEVAYAPPTETIDIKDGNYHITLGYSYIFTEIKTGNIGAPFTKEYDIRPPYNGSSYSYETSTVRFRKQINDTQYQETLVVGLKHVNYIYSGHTVDSTINSEQMLIPLNYGIVRNMGIQRGNTLMYRSIYIVFNSYEEVKLKWYQTGFFQIVLLVAAIAITIITYQPGMLTQSILGASAAGLTSLALILTDIVLAFAIKEGFQLVAQVVSPEIAFALSIVLSAYAVGSVMGTGSVAGLPFANEALFVANHLSKASMEVGMKEIQAESEEFQEYAAAEQERLDDQWEDLQPKSDLDPLDLFTSFGENDYWQTPDTYIYQSVHAGNIGATTLESIHAYVENTLSLPSTANSLGVDINV